MLWLLLLVYLSIGFTLAVFGGRVVSLAEDGDETLDLGMIVLGWPVYILILGFAVLVYAFGKVALWLRREVSGK